MSSEKGQLKIRHLLIYGGGIVLVFLIGTVFGLMLRKPPPAPGPAFITATPTPPSLGLVPTKPSVTEPIATPCRPLPAGWAPYTVESGDTLSELAYRVGVSQQSIQEVNCLTSPELLAGQVIYLPVLPPPTPCIPSPPAGWRLYIVQAGDTLSELARFRGVPLAEVMRVNCRAAPDIVEGQSLYLPRRPTPTPCVPVAPAGWGLYTISVGDTLFSLAAARGTTTAEVMQVNCLLSESIVVGQELYLPLLSTPSPAQPIAPTPLPTLIPTAVAQVFPTPPFSTAPDTATIPPQSFPGPDSALISPELPVTPASTVFSNAGLPDLAFVSGLPGLQPPCRSPAPASGDPWVDVRGLQPLQYQQKPYKVWTGQRPIMFACDFKDPQTLTAWITDPKGKRQPLSQGLYLPLDRDDFILTDTIRGAVVWNITCNSTPGRYELTVQDSKSPTQTIRFELLDPKQFSSPEILVVPEAVRAGHYFEVYYCGYEAKSKLPVSLHRADVSGQKREWYKVDEWQVPINEAGWGWQRLWPLPNDRIGYYVLTAEPGGQGSFWVFR